MTVFCVLVLPFFRFTFYIKLLSLGIAIFWKFFKFWFLYSFLKILELMTSCDCILFFVPKLTYRFDVGLLMLMHTFPASSFKKSIWAVSGSYVKIVRELTTSLSIPVLISNDSKCFHINLTFDIMAIFFSKTYANFLRSRPFSMLRSTKL